MSFLGLMVMGVTAAYGSQSDQPKMNGKLRVTTLSADEIRYTGKPYSKELGAYLFNYRNYSPEMSRWSTPDPSGFPDGANNQAYSPVPTYQLDYQGLYNITDPQKKSTIAWVFWCTDNSSDLFKSALDRIKNEMTLSSKDGYYASNLDGTLESASSTADILGFANKYTQIILVCHGFAYGNPNNPIYEIGSASGGQNSLTPLKAFGNSARSILYATCANAWSPYPTTGATGDEFASTLADWMANYTEGYLKE